MTHNVLPTTLHPLHPDGVSLICRIDQRFLLVERGKEPLKGSLAFPGGGVEAGETGEQAAHREFWEETALRCQELKLVAAIDLHQEGLYSQPYILNVYRALAISGIACAGDDAVSLHWLSVDEMLDRKVTLSTLALAQRIAAEEDGS